jgi:SAM-dependent methyltransferase
MRDSEWFTYLLKDYRLQFAPGGLVLDLGCGPCGHMEDLRGEASAVIGIDRNLAALQACDRGGLRVQGRAEHLPFRSEVFDGILCKVVLPYTREDEAVREIGRLLKPGGRCYLQCQGAGYFLRYLLCAPTWRLRVYGLRSLMNTWLLVTVGWRLPAWLGDSIYQSRSRLARLFAHSKLVVVDDSKSPTFLGFPVFTYQILEKRT